jgi:heterodisulfide reductase subunit A-like polyferredoxin
VAEVTDAARLPGEEGKLIIQVEDTLAGKQRRIPVDMVVLSAGCSHGPMPRKYGAVLWYCRAAPMAGSSRSTPSSTRWRR